MSWLHERIVTGDTVLGRMPLYDNMLPPDQINQITKRLYDINGRVGSHLEENELLQSITQRSSIPGGPYSFDLPEYHYWLTQDESIQAKD